MKGASVQDGMFATQKEAREGVGCLHLLLSLTDLGLTVDLAACLCSPVLGLWACSGMPGLVCGCWGFEHKPSCMQHYLHTEPLPALRFLLFPLFHSFLITVVFLAEVSCLDRGV